jgi:hypothetical protein
MKRKYICIVVMVLIICALFPGPMLLGDCESCSTDDVTPYTEEGLRASLLEAEEMSETLYDEIQEQIKSLYAQLEKPPTEKEEKLSTLIRSFYSNYVEYLQYLYQETEGEIISSMTEKSNEGYLVITKTEPVDTLAVETALVYRDQLQRNIGARYDIIRSYYDPRIDVLEAYYYDLESYDNIDYCAILDDMIAQYEELSEATINCATLMTKYDILMQAKKQEILTGGAKDGNCDTPGAGDSLEDDETYYMTGFTWVKAWVGAYSSQSPEGAETFIGQYCTTTHRTLDQHLSYAVLFISFSTKSVQVKYFFTVYTSGDKHNAIYEGNRSIYNLNGSYSVGGAMINFTNGVAWTYGASYDGSSTPSNGNYVFEVNDDWLVCCDNDEWCNTHCGSCFACDIGADQNFFTS